MTTSNEELLEKSVITAQEHLAVNGKLYPKQAEQFLDWIIDETKLWKDARTERFRNEEMVIDKIGVSGRVAMPATEGVDPGVRFGVNTSKITLRPVEIISPYEISQLFKEINVEGEKVANHISQMMARRLGNNLEQLSINGDELGPAVIESEIKEGGSATQYVLDSYMGLINGWWRIADNGNVYDHENGTTSATLFNGMINAMPTRFRKDRSQLVFLAPSDLEQDYRLSISNRGTKLGDDTINATQDQTPFGIQLVPCPLLDPNPYTTEHVALPGTAWVDLRYKPITDIVVVPTTITPNVPISKYIEGTDYTEDLVNGRIQRIGTGAIGDGQTVKVTYRSQGQILLVNMKNLIIALGRDIFMERDRDIFKRMDQFVTTVKMDVHIENVEGVVKGINIAQSTP